MLIRSKRFLLLAAAPLAVVTGLAVAQTAPAPETNGASADARPLAAQFHRHHDRHGRAGGFGGPELMRDLFSEVDADGSGNITQEEIDAFQAAQVQSADQNGDGAIDLEEFSAVYLERMRPMMVDAFQRFDDDGDGSITEAELDERFGDVVSRLDRDGDGALSPQDHGRHHNRH
jgi:hypothetical protein